MVLIGLKALNDCINNCHYGDKSSRFTFVYVMLFVFLCVLPAQAAITIPGADGSDGALQITATTVIDLSEAVTGAWDADNSANAGKGIYDSEKWAVVFKYSSVNIDAGATLSFSNHPSRAPVVWLVNGNVTIDGTVSLNGQGYQTPPLNSQPGPGGFRGGAGTYDNWVKAGSGLGPGGGQRSSGVGYGGSYGSIGGNGPERYGNQSLIPLIGGSGGGSDINGTKSGGAGGGAILIACKNTLSVNGVLRSNGGNGYNDGPGGGSGGGIRLIADILAGTGTVNALGGDGYKTYDGGLGRISIERVVNDNTLVIVPETDPIHLSSETTATLWPPDNAPKVKILSIGGKTPPDDPRASFGTYGADVALPEVSTTQVVVETTNVEQASQVIVRVTPRFNANYITANATVDNVVSTDPLVIHWIADLSVNVGYSAVQVKVVRP
ncbi:MAG: hypothetical protein OMM_01810 [Candidatus Magnetoglobus multicellularis str. Araruama]|uniref:Uncharacterized protein n=1 Tax=Candidatus Magnetoglobus multicellularis str. Araruama TaxID=890399 RepID=A0A1V1PBM7_9BACT|nr:MAG: hypothetical protein OMM_01810 [Candidatus Magnetoglobus multicellularis str. Araruama]